MNTIQTILNSILGEYNPITYTMESIGPDSTTIYNDIIPSGLAGVDWSYIFAGAFYLMVFYAMLRIIGGHLRK